MKLHRVKISKKNFKQAYLKFYEGYSIRFYTNLQLLIRPLKWLLIDIGYKNDKILKKGIKNIKLKIRKFLIHNVQKVVFRVPQGLETSLAA